MIRLILILGLVVFFVPSLAGASDDDSDSDEVECEIELDDDGFTEVEYENDLTGAECDAEFGPGVPPSAADLQCVELCRALLPMQEDPATCPCEVFDVDFLLTLDWSDPHGADLATGSFGFLPNGEGHPPQCSDFDPMTPAISLSLSGGSGVVDHCGSLITAQDDQGEGASCTWSYRADFNDACSTAGAVNGSVVGMTLEEVEACHEIIRQTAVVLGATDILGGGETCPVFP